MSSTGRIALGLAIILVAWFLVYYRIVAPTWETLSHTDALLLTDGDSIGANPADREPATSPTGDSPIQRDDGQATPPPDSNDDAIRPGANVSDTPGGDADDATADGQQRPNETSLPPPPATTPYTVRVDDTMEAIAASWFGNRSKWILIAQENPFVDPLKLESGQVLRLPPRDARLQDIPPDQLSRLMSATRYIVSSNDTLSEISQQYYGKASHWRLIYEANRDVLTSPDDLSPGTQLTIPPLPAR